MRAQALNSFPSIHDEPEKSEKVLSLGALGECSVDTTIYICVLPSCFRNLVLHLHT